MITENGDSATVILVAVDRGHCLGRSSGNRPRIVPFTGGVPCGEVRNGSILGW